MDDSAFPDFLGRPLRLGAVRYLNAEPLVAAIDDASLLRRTPSELRSLLIAGDIDLATLSVAAALADDRLALLPSMGIATRGAVRSVLLFHKVALDQVRTVALDPASVTSNVLAEILLRKRWGIDAATVPDREQADAFVRIGDPALREGRFPFIDLGQAWHEWTGLPFVFATWIAGPSLSLDQAGWRALDGRLAAIAERGLTMLESIAARQDVLPAEQALAYLRDRLTYRLDGSFRDGIGRFAAEAAAIGFGRGEVRWAC